MDNELKRDFTMRISQANPTELIVVTYDIILELISDAKKASRQSDKETVFESCKKAVRFIADLMGALDFHYDISRNLWSLYEYAQKQLISAGYSGSIEALDSSRDIFLGLRSSYAAICANDTSQKVMKNAQSVFAGLTYSKGHLDEISVDPNGAKRGFYV